jgi:protein SCO1/2
MRAVSRTVLCGLLALVIPLTGSSAAALPSLDRVRIIDPPRPIDDTELTDQRGKPLRLSELRGRIALIFFGFTHCPDVCPLAMERMRLLEESGQVEPESIAFVLISVDGERDTPAALRAFLARFSPSFIGLRAEADKIQTLAGSFSASFFAGNRNNDGEYLISHSPQIFVLDTRGRLRAEFYNASVEAMARISRALLEEAN